MSKRFALLLLAAAFAAACQSPAPPPPTPEPEPVVTPSASGVEEKPAGTVRVTASKVNIRSAASTSDSIVATAKRGDRLGLIRTEGSWSRVKTSSGIVGWVSKKLVKNEKNCPADRDFEIVDGPPLSFSQDGAHGTVVVEATVETTGKVSATRVTRNTTGDASMAKAAEQEIRTARFSAPVRNCVPKRFIYVYTRTY